MADYLCMRPNMHFLCDMLLSCCSGLAKCMLNMNKCRHISRLSSQSGWIICIRIISVHNFKFEINISDRSEGSTVSHVICD